MITSKVALTQPLSADRQFVATSGSEHHILLDDAAGGTGPKPIELVAAGLAGCTAFDVITILRHKYHQKVTGYEVRVEADQAERPPQVFIAVRLHHVVTGFEIDPAAIEEAIRLYPPIAAISRVALDHDDLNGEAVRPGSLVVISPYVLHRHRLLWDRPDAFDPRRFLGGAQATNDRFAYLPFGAGPRKCIGSTFALQEATLVLAVIVKHFRFQLKAAHAVWPTLRVTLRPANGLPMILSKRSQ